MTAQASRTGRLLSVIGVLLLVAGVPWPCRAGETEIRIAPGPTVGNEMPNQPSWLTSR